MREHNWFPISASHDPFIVEWSPKAGNLNLRVKRRGHEAFLYLECPKAQNAYGYAINQWRQRMEGKYGRNIC